jgi:hypothetical protein
MRALLTSWSLPKQSETMYQSHEQNASSEIQIKAKFAGLIYQAPR